MAKSNPWKAKSWSNQYGIGAHRIDKWKLPKIWKAIEDKKSVTISSPQSSRYTDDGRIYDIDSTAIDDVKYDSESEIASVKFVHGDKWYDYRVTPEEFKEFLNASSRGSHAATIWNHNSHFHV